MVSCVSLMLKTVKSVEDKALRGTRALESSIEAVKQATLVSGLCYVCVVLCCAVLCCVVLCYVVVLCCVVLCCCVVLYCVVLCYAMLLFCKVKEIFAVVNLSSYK